MNKLLLKLFVKDYQNTKDKKVREKYGVLAGSVGIVSNIVLFTIKIVIGTFVNSIAIIADAFNNLSDVGSSFITIFGFKLSGKPADKEHPFGHGRIEYIAGLIVAFFVILVGIEFIKTSYNKIVNPQPVKFILIPFVLLMISIGIKIWLSIFYRRLGKAIDSQPLKATSVDAISDVISSSIVVLSFLLARFTTLPIDGYIGMVVSLIILYAGFNLVKETLDPLIGMAPEKELVKEVYAQLLNYKQILGAHDLLVHNYGPGRIIASIHAEVPANLSLVEVHDTIDNAEKQISEKLGIHLVIHVDPLSIDKVEILEAKQIVKETIKQIPEVKQYQNFRLQEGDGFKMVVFDCLVDLAEIDDQKLFVEEIKTKISARKENYVAIVKLKPIKFRKKKNGLVNNKVKF